MSYILDALKKADAERERGSVPGLHSQHMGVDDDDDEDSTPARATPPLVWVGAGVGLCIIALLSWKLLARDAEPQAMPPPPPPDLGQANEAMPAARTAAVPPAKEAPPMTPKPAPEVRPVPAPAPPPAPQAVAREARPTPTVASATPPPTSKPAATRVPLLNELPDDVRREIPQLVIGGAMYSETPASRMLIVNSQVFHEGDQPYQGLVLEEIRLKSAIFKYRGYRYAVNY